MEAGLRQCCEDALTRKGGPYPTGLRKMVKSAFTDDTSKPTTLSIDHRRKTLVWRRKDTKKKEAWGKEVVEIDLRPADEKNRQCLLQE